MNHFRKVSQPCLTTRGFTALRCPFGATLSLVRHGLASFGLQTFLRTKTVNKKVSTFKGALTTRAHILTKMTTYPMRIYTFANLCPQKFVYPSCLTVGNPTQNLKHGQASSGPKSEGAMSTGHRAEGRPCA